MILKNSVDGVKEENIEHKPIGVKCPHLIGKKLVNLNVKFIIVKTIKIPHAIDIRMF